MKGLNNQEVINNRKKYGSNIITNKKKDSFFKLLIKSLSDPIIKILLIALLIKTILLFKHFDWYETLGVLVAVFLASFISSISEYSSEKAFIRLGEVLSKMKYQVKRENTITEINIDDIVVGDIVILTQGDNIPADGIIISGELIINESALTGEQKEIYKSLDADNKLYRGSTVYGKHALMKVTAVGDNTFYGKINKEVQEKKSDSPLKLRLRHLAKTISNIGYLGAFLGSISYLFSTIVIKNNFDINLIINTLKNTPLLIDYLLHAITLSVTIIIVAVPEGLPMMITLVLSSNMKRMIKKNVLVRKLVGIETAGSLNVLFFDKTGTITQGKQVVTAFVDANLNEYNKIEKLEEENIFDIFKLSIICNNESFLNDNNVITGSNSVDKALFEYARKYMKDKKNIISSVSFNSNNKYSIVKINYNNKDINLIKGASEVLLNKCTHYYNKNLNKKLLLNKDKLNKYIEMNSAKGIRIISLAINEHGNDKVEDLTLIGFIFLKDEIRPSAKNAIKLINNAGIKTIMITGDNKGTALSIAKEVGIFKNEDICLTREELISLTDEEIKKIFSKISVISRVLPTDKSRLVNIAKNLNLVCGMTGDGINDAPALKKADVGFSMGSGCEVAKEASDIVILDDDINSIKDSILFGRTIFKSIRKFIIFQLSINICAVIISILGPLIGVLEPITVVQMLWINMIMDTLAAVAFSYEVPLDEYMEEKTKDKNEKIINKYMQSHIFLSACVSAIICILFLKLNIIKNIYNTNLMTGFFTLFIFLGIFNSFNARTIRINLLSNISKNKAFLLVFLIIISIQIYLIYYGGIIFRTTGLTLLQLQITILISFTIIITDLLRKLLLRTINIKTGV